jgi:Domain of unknown function (DUF4381)
MSTELLNQLRDIHLPPQIGYWPPAPGWIILAVLIVLGIAVTLYYVRRRHQQQKAYRYALASIEQLSYQNAHNQRDKIPGQLSILLRRVALHYFPRNEIAGLSGQAWLDFLNESGKTTAFTSKTGQQLLTTPYQKPSSMDFTPLIGITRNWLMTIATQKGP